MGGVGRRGRGKRREQGKDQEEREGREGEQRARMVANGNGQGVPRAAPLGLPHLLVQLLLTATLLGWDGCTRFMDDNTEVKTTEVICSGPHNKEVGRWHLSRKGTEGQEVGGLEVETWKSTDRESAEARRRQLAMLAPSANPGTHNAVWGRCAANETLHLATVTPHGILHRLAGDNGGPCKQKRRSGSAGSYRTCPPRPSPSQDAHR